MSPEYHETSPYFAAVRAAIEGFRTSGVGWFTPHELAKKMGRNVTASQRAALKRACDLGLCAKIRYGTEAGGVGVGYVIYDQSQLPLDTNEAPF